MILNNGERLDDLEYKGLKIIQREGLYHFTSDSVLLANIVKVRNGDRVLDMGTGSGIIAILIAAKNQVTVTGIDIQNVMVDMAMRSVEMNNLQHKVKILKQDIKSAPKELGYDSYDVVVSNPPYSKLNSGDMNAQDNISISRHEVMINLEQLIESAAKLVKFGGKFFLIHKAERLAEIIELMCRYNLTPKKLINILPKSNKAVDTVIVEGKKGAKHGMKIEALTVYNDDNTMTKAAAKLYSKEI